MQSRERVQRAVAFQSVDKPALECDVNPVAIYEHGEKIRELFQTIEGDFGPISTGAFEMPGPADFDEQGNYLAYKQDDWGITWVHRIFGIQGHPHKRPLDDWANLADYKLPPIERLTPESEAFHHLKTYFDDRKSQGFYAKAGFFGLLERAYALRQFEDVLADLAAGDEDFLELTDRMTARYIIESENLVMAGADGVQIGDDFGAQDTMLISPNQFREVYKPRYRDILAPAKAAGKQVFCHSCGQITPILQDLKDIGVDAIWPQIALYDLRDFAARCRDIGLAVAIHPDRSGLMTHGTPDEVYRRMYEYAEAFHPENGGSWFYLEIDNGFPYENIEAMVRAVREMRT